MRPQTLRRLAADLNSLHDELPVNYLFDPSHTEHDDLTQLDILLAGPSHTPFAAGVWKLHLSMPEDYPTLPPTANFRTPIFHPNVHPETGGVCVETLKRDWDSKLTLKDVLITISCLLIQPNPDSALNAEAGSLIQEDFEMFARRARLLTSIHAVVPLALGAAVREAQTRGQEQPDPAPVRRRRPIVRAQRQAASRLSDASPAERALGRRQNFAHTPVRDDVFQAKEDDEMVTDQENFSDSIEAISPAVMSTPRRPPGPPVPLGELKFDSPPEVNSEYPPSPKKSRSRSPIKRLVFGESSRQAQTPSFFTEADTSFTVDASFNGQPLLLQPSQVISRHTEDEVMEPAIEDHETGIVSNVRLWELCGRDVDRWNRGDFDRQPFKMVASRW